jgi:lipopolysaccharide/colanic/teichoic acid biosynthesis glycosyltransferase
MKIVIVASLARSLINFRRSLLQSIAASGEHDVLALAPEHDEKVAKELEKIGVRFRRIPMARTSLNPLADLGTLWSLVSIFRAERPDLVLAYTQKPIIYAGMAARLAPHARYFAMQSGLGFAFSEENRNELLRRFVAGLYRIGVARAEALFVFNSDDKEEMRRYGIIGRKHRVVQVSGSGVDLQQFPQRLFADGPQTFLLVARLMRDKGHYEFVDAARRLRADFPSARFQILGPFDANPAGIPSSDVEAWRRDNVVEYLGETDDVRPYLAQSSVFVLPSFHREGLPRSILEAMATGRAIITTPTPGCRETVIEAENGYLVPARDPIALAEAMKRFLVDPALAPRMGAASRRLAEARFDVNLVNDQLLRAMGLRGTPPRVASRPHPSDAARRAIDVTLSFVGCIVAMPIAATIAAAILLTMGRPVFFKQQRAGRDGAFRLVKFRTMTDARDADGNLLDDAARVTPLGRFLRRSRLDELPELWSIFVGDMSFVGPRPLPPDSPLNRGGRGAERLSVRPGLTGWAQVNGNTLLSADQKLALDLWYVRSRSLRLDFMILIKTVGVVLFGEKLGKTVEAGK